MSESPSERTGVDVVIVNWMSGDQLRQCLSSLDLAERISFDLGSVIIVDNASDDGSLALPSYRLPIVIIKNDRNLGFGAAANLGVARGSAPFILFLNPDVRLFRDSLDRAAAFMTSAEGEAYGVCGIQMIDDSNAIAKSCARVPRPSHFVVKALGLDQLSDRFETHVMTEWPHDRNADVDHVIGAFYLVRRDLFQTLGGFDERFFIYLEDLDLSVRIRQSGSPIRYLTTARAYHKGGGSSEQAKAMRLFQSLKSRILYARKHFGFPAAALVTIVTMGVEPVARVVQALYDRSMDRLRDTAGAYAMLWRDSEVWGAARGVSGREGEGESV